MFEDGGPPRPDVPPPPAPPAKPLLRRLILIPVVAVLLVVAVELYVVDGGGHHWPGAREEPAYAPLAEAIDELGEPSPVSANDLMWSFFARHPRR